MGKKATAAPPAAKANAAAKVASAASKTHSDGNDGRRAVLKRPAGSDVLPGKMSRKKKELIPAQSASVMARPATAARIRVPARSDRSSILASDLPAFEGPRTQQERLQWYIFTLDRLVGSAGPGSASSSDWASQSDWDSGELQSLGITAGVRQTMKDNFLKNFVQVAKIGHYDGYDTAGLCIEFLAKGLKRRGLPYPAQPLCLHAAEKCSAAQRVLMSCPPHMCAKHIFRRHL